MKKHKKKHSLKNILLAVIVAIPISVVTLGLFIGLSLWHLTVRQDFSESDAMRNILYFEGTLEESEVILGGKRYSPIRSQYLKIQGIGEGFHTPNQYVQGNVKTYNAPYITDELYQEIQSIPLGDSIRIAVLAADYHKEGWVYAPLIGSFFFRDDNVIVHKLWHQGRPLFQLDEKMYYKFGYIPTYWILMASMIPVIFVLFAWNKWLSRGNHVNHSFQ